MKKNLNLLFFVLLSTYSFSQLHSGEVLYSLDLGTSEITHIYDEDEMCIKKTSPHSKGMFVSGEKVSISTKENIEVSEIVKIGLTERIFAQKACNLESEKGTIVRSIKGHIYENPITGKFYLEVVNPNKYVVHHFEFQIEIQNNDFFYKGLTDDEIISHITLYEKEFKAKIRLTLDNKIVYLSRIIDGDEVIEDFSPITLYPCTFDGLSKCTQDRIAKMNWYEKTICILTNTECVGQTFVSCAVDNC
jgi:hypothetical protein